MIREEKEEKGKRGINRNGFVGVEMKGCKRTKEESERRIRKRGMEEDGNV
jgi:hypothetical protein